MITSQLKNNLKRIKAIRKKLSKIKIGLPTKVEFHFNKGLVQCYPKERKWIVQPNGKPITTHLISPADRNDVTKFKAKYFLKLAWIGILRNDAPH